MAVKPPATAGTRDLRLDALRGLLLLQMTGTHVRTPISEWTHAPLGFVGSAEGFILVSAYLVGRVYSEQLARQGAAVMTRKLLSRAAKVYVVHLALVLLAVLLGWRLAASLPTFANHFGAFLANPFASLLMTPLLLHQPPLFDILPLYVVYLVLTPGLLLAVRRFGCGPVAMISGSVWLLVQLSPRLVPRLDALGIRGIHLGQFDLLAWQLLWVMGVALGQRTTTRVAHASGPQPRGPFIAALCVGTACLILRYGVWPLAEWNQLISTLSDKWRLGPLRLLNLLALLGIVLCVEVRAPSSLLKLPSLVGRHSLSLFGFHILLAMFAIALLESAEWTRAGAAALGLWCIVAVGVAGWLLEARRARRSSFVEVVRPAM